VTATATMPTTKDELLEQMREARSTWIRVVSAIPDAVKVAPLLPNGWSVKDVIAHVAIYEHWTAEQLDAPRDQRSPFEVPGEHVLSGADELTEDAINAMIYDHFKDIALTDVMHFADRAFHDLLVAIEATPEEHLMHPVAWADGQSPLAAIPGQSYERYHDHLRDVRTLAGAEVG
jgi:hypothetical protein